MQNQKSESQPRGERKLQLQPSSGLMSAPCHVTSYRNLTLGRLVLRGLYSTHKIEAACAGKALYIEAFTLLMNCPYVETELHTFYGG